MDEDDEMKDNDLDVARGFKNAFIMMAIIAATIFGAWYLANKLLGGLIK